MSDLDITVFDPADALNSAASIAAYVDLVADETGYETEAILKAMGVAVRASGSALVVATKAGLTSQEVEAALTEGASPSFAAVLGILRGLGMRIRFEVDGCCEAGEEL
ncbi:hypothetical protein D3C87_1495730 [compost metagenome]